MQDHSAQEFLLFLKRYNKPYSLVIDIDDTLIDCRHRKKRVISDFVRQMTDSPSGHDEHLRLLEGIGLEQVKFRISECLLELNIANEQLERDLFDFWRQHYFTYPYLKTDIAFPGATSFVRQCLEAGAHIIYLTGRDEPGMGLGTRERLKEIGFPLQQDDVSLILKPDPEQEDLLFKQEALQEIETSFPPVLAFFENEVRNLNMMAQHFPQSMLFWRPTLQSPNQPDPHPSILNFARFD